VAYLLPLMSKTFLFLGSASSKIPRQKSERRRCSKRVSKRFLTAKEATTQRTEFLALANSSWDGHFVRLKLSRAAHDGVRDTPKGQREMLVRALQVRVCFVFEFSKFIFPLLVYVRLVLGRRGVVLDQGVAFALCGNCSGVDCWCGESGGFGVGCFSCRR